MFAPRPTLAIRAVIRYKPCAPTIRTVYTRHNRHECRATIPDDGLYYVWCLVAPLSREHCAINTVAFTDVL